MAHRVLGIDLGSYSVKVAVVVAGFRKSTVVDWLEQPVPPGPEPFEERATAVLGAMLRARGVVHDIPYAAMGGETLSIRILDFPFHGLKRAELDKAVGSELEAQLPHDLDDMVYAYEILPRSTLVPALEGDPVADVPRTVAGTRILAAATTRDRVQRLLDVTGRELLEPHAVVAAPTAYGRVASSLAAYGGIEAAGDDVLLIDHGHTRTNVAVLRGGRVLFARTISRGGRHVTQSIAAGWPDMSWDDAERAKHDEGFIASSREPAPTDAWRRVSEQIRPALEPLVRELRQTIAACRAQTGAVVVRAILAGGGSRLNGLPGYLSEQLDLPVGIVTADDAPHLLGPMLTARGVPADTALLALGTALEGASGRPAFDLRQGALAYKQDFSFLRAKASVLVGCAILLVAFFAGDAYANLYKLRAERDVLDKRLAAETTEIFGAPVSAADLEGKISPHKEDSPLPRMTAFDLLVEISKKMPAKSDIKLDVMEMTIEPKKIFLKAIADSQASIDAVVKKLREIECFTDVTTGRTDTVNDGRQFTLTIAMKCM